MTEETFISCVGPPELHDGVICKIEERESNIMVLISCVDGSTWTLEFVEVAKFIAETAEGMILYALAEFANIPPCRKFIFLNWDEEGESSLQVIAQEVKFTRANSSTSN